MQATLNKLLKGRADGFLAFKGSIISTDATGSKYMVKGTDYRDLVDDQLEYILVTKTGKVSYIVEFSGNYDATDAVAAYQRVLSFGLLEQGYNYGTKQQSGKTTTYSITYKGAVISTCRYTDNGTETEAAIEIVK
jgi:hypothetical protein